MFSLLLKDLISDFYFIDATVSHLVADTDRLPWQIHHNRVGVQAKFHNYVPHRRGGGHIVFGADPVGVGFSVGFGVGVGVTLSCLHDIS